MSEKTDKKIHWRTVGVAVLIGLVLSSSGQVSSLVTKSRDTDRKLLELKKINEDQQRQLDNLKRRLEKLERKE